MRDNKVWQVNHYRKIEPTKVGGIHLGKVTYVDPSVNAAFIDLGSNIIGFLSAKDAVSTNGKSEALSINKLIHEGQTIKVEVTADGFANKGPRLKQLQLDVSSPKHQAPACINPPPEPLDSILSMCIRDKVSRVVFSDAYIEKKLMEWLQVEGKRESFRLEYEEPSLFEKYEVDDAISSALLRKVILQNGAEIVFEQYETLCAIDVNSAKFAGQAKRGSLDINLFAMQEIARQLRLRRLGGAIVIDALKMNSNDDRKVVLKALREQLKDDPFPTHVLGFSHLGLIEMTRARRGPSLSESLTKNISSSVPTAETIAYNLMREMVGISRKAKSAGYTLRASAEVVNVLNGDLKDTFAEAASKIGQVTIEICSDRTSEKWEIVPDKIRISHN